MIEFQLSLSTAEDEQNYFTGTPMSVITMPDPSSVMPPGDYRVIDGEVYRIQAGLPPAMSSPSVVR